MDAELTPTANATSYVPPFCHKLILGKWVNGIKITSAAMILVF